MGNNNNFQIKQNRKETLITQRLAALHQSYPGLKVDPRGDSLNKIPPIPPKRVESITLTTYLELDRIFQKLELWAKSFANKKVHPNIIRTTGYYYIIHGEEGSSRWNITFFLINQIFKETLDEYQRRLPESFQNPKETIELYKAIEPALACIHDNNSYHGSLSPSKIYLREDHYAFSGSENKEKREDLWEIGFSIDSFSPVLAPVYLSDKLAKTPKSKWHDLSLVDKQNGDKFALGMILLKTYSGQNLFGQFTANINFENKDQKIIDLVNKIVYKYKEDQELVDLILGMLYKGLDEKIEVKIREILLKVIRSVNNHSNSCIAELFPGLGDVTRLPSSHNSSLPRYKCNNSYSDNSYD